MKKVTITLEQFGPIEVNPMILDPNYRENYCKISEPIIVPDEKMVVVVTNSKPRKAKRINKPKPETKPTQMKTDFEKKEAVSKSASRKDCIFKTIPVNTSAMIPVKIDSKTTVFAKDLADVERIKLKYAKKG